MRWQQQCCVPAFLATAIAHHYGNFEFLALDKNRAACAQALGTVAAAHEQNPWNLPVSSQPHEWGVSFSRAIERFDSLQQLMAQRGNLALRIIPINEVGFEQYEAEARNLLKQQAVVGIGFDYERLARQQATWRQPSQRAHHLCRLTPFTPKEKMSPTIASPEFGFDYAGQVRLFDDSGELDDNSQVEWRNLIGAARSADGAFWAVMPVSPRSTPQPDLA